MEVNAVDSQYIKVEHFEDYSSQNNSESMSNSQSSSFHCKQNEINEPAKKGSSKNVSQNRKKIYRKYLRSYLDKYFIQISKQEFQKLIDEIQLVKLKQPNLRQLRELSASVFYFHFVDLIGIFGTKQFCVRNALKNKVFNKRYKLCCRELKKKQLKLQNTLINAKLQQTNEGKLKVQASGQIGQLVRSRPMDKIYRLTVVQILDSIFDQLFRGGQYQSNRREIILKIAEKYQKTSPRIFHQMSFTDLRIEKILYIIYYNFKKYGSNLFFNQFKAVANTNLGIKLDRKNFIQTQKIFTRLEDKQEEETCKQQVPQQQGSYLYY